MNFGYVELRTERTVITYRVTVRLWLPKTEQIVFSTFSASTGFCNMSVHLLPVPFSVFSKVMAVMAMIGIVALSLTASRIISVALVAIHVRHLNIHKDQVIGACRFLFYP